MLPRSIVSVALLSAFALARNPHPLSAWPGVKAKGPLPWESGHHHDSTDDDLNTVSLTISPGSLTEAYSSWVTITVTGAPFGINDTIAIYSPPPSSDDLKGVSPIQYWPASECSPPGGSSCSIQAFLLNGRQPLVAGYVMSPQDSTSDSAEAPLGHHDALGFSNVVSFPSPYLPTGPRIVGTGKDGEMLITWTSGGDASQGPFVTFWPADNATEGASAASAAARTTVQAFQSISYSPSDLCGEPATTKGYRDPGYFHSALLTGLEPKQRYSYTFGDSNAVFPTNLTFTALPVLGDASLYPFSIAAWGDMGHSTYDGSQEKYLQPPASTTMKLLGNSVDSGEVSLLWHFGDLSYGRGYVGEWDNFDYNWSAGKALGSNATGNIQQGGNAATGKVPYIVSAGNHEFNYITAPMQGYAPSFFNVTDSGGECGVVLQKRYPMPAFTSQAAPWMKFSFGPVLFVNMNTETSFLEGSEQWNWLKATMEAVDRSVTPFVVFSGHRPMYVDSTADGAPDSDQVVARLLRANVEPLLQNAGGSPVDLMIYGHHHSYQRGCAVLNATCVTSSTLDQWGQRVFQSPKAPVTMLVGTAGADFSTNFNPQPPSYTEMTSLQWGYGLLTFHNTSALEFTFVTDDDGKVGDRFFILK